MDQLEWQRDYDALCPICLRTRGEHYNGYCPLPNGLPPSTRLDKGMLMPVAGPDQPRGRWGVPITYGNTQAPTCAPMKDKVSAPINDHICPTCKNDRCSLPEVTCWKCGGKL